MSLSSRMICTLAHSNPSLIFGKEEPATGDTTKAQYAASALYPSSSKAVGFIVDQTGHAINVHTSAKEAYKQMLTFLQENGL